MKKGFQIVLIMVMLLGLIGSAASMQTATPRAQIQLAQMAAEQPDALVRVIVQKVSESTGAEAQVEALGGLVTQDLSIIKGFVAEMRASAAMELARAEGVRWVSLDAPTQSSNTKNTSWSTKLGTTVANGFTNPTNFLSAAGINGTYGYGAKVKGAFGGFLVAQVPGDVITKVEVVLRLYTPVKLGTSETPKLTAYVGGKAGTAVSVNIPTSCVSPNVGTLGIDITSSRTSWRWADFSNGMEILIDQSAVASNHPIYYDAIGLRISTASGIDTSSALTMAASSDGTGVDTSVMKNVFPQVVRATNVWNTAPYYKGSGVGVAVIDSGNFRTNGLGTRLLGEVNFATSEHTSSDQYGHGTHVSGIIADDGSTSGGQYMGVALKANIIGLRVADDFGMAYESDVVSAMQWVYNNRTAYNIRVVNLSLNSTVYQPYDTSPMDAAAEILWFNSVVVVVSAGNVGSAGLYPPANDPFVITVGATDDLATAGTTDDAVASFSAYGLDDLGRPKPDLVAPGRNIIAYLPDVNSLTIPKTHPEGVVNSNYFRMSGTSMAAPVVSGAVALLVESNPNLTPDQIKYRLMNTANKNWPGYNATTAGAGYLDVDAAVNGTTTQSANTGVLPSHLLSTGTNPITWGSVGWNSVGWNSVGWNSVGWNSVGWNSVGWNSDYWGQ